MKIRSHRLAWALFLLGSGLFLLLKSNGVFREFGDALWGGLFAVVGLGFLIWFLIDRLRHWRALAGFPLLTIGILILLAWRGINLGDWQAPLVLFGVALGFWTVLLAQDDSWWALIPAGVLTLMGVLIGFQARLSQATWLGLFFLGLGSVFGLLYLLRLGQRDTGWAGIPAAALLLIGLVTLVGPSKAAAPLTQWWPAVLVIGGIAMLFFALRGAERVVPLTVGESASGPAPAPAGLPAPTAPAQPPASEPPVDIYTLLSEQPQGDKATK